MIKRCSEVASMTIDLKLGKYIAVQSYNGVLSQEHNVGRTKRYASSCRRRMPPLKCDLCERGCLFYSFCISDTWKCPAHNCSSASIFLSERMIPINKIQEHVQLHDTVSENPGGVPDSFVPPHLGFQTWNLSDWSQRWVHISQMIVWAVII